MKIKPLKSLDKLIHEKGRMGIMALLAGSQELSFSEIKNLLEMTDGNLSVSLKKLQNAGYIDISKSFLNNKPLTLCRMTDTGRKRFKEYVETLEEIVKETKR